MSVSSTRSLSNQDHWQFVAACALSLILMVTDEQTQVVMEARMFLSSAIQPLEWLARLPENWIGQGNRVLTERSALTSEIDKLRLQVLLLSQQLQQSQSINQENDRLRMLLGVASRINQGKLLVGIIVDHSPDPFRQIVRINKGLRDGIITGLPVMDAQGLMGQVLSVNLSESDILLVSDLAMQIPVRVVRTGARGIVQGDGNNELNLKFLPTTSNIREGDLLETSGLDGRYPSGIPVAEVISIKSQAGSVFWQVTAQPVAKVGSSREVLLLINQTKPNTEVITP
jgi:rod shape-determining protein MreC